MPTSQVRQDRKDLLAILDQHSVALLVRLEIPDRKASPDQPALPVVMQDLRVQQDHRALQAKRVTPDHKA